jgi:glycosyltransferase involved in cell wall biosynthesis
MKVLWLTNVLIPRIAKEIGVIVKPVGGWIDGMISQLESNSELQITFVGPYDFLEIKKGVCGKIDYVCFHKGFQYVKLYSIFTEVIKHIQPQIIHIWGTEYLHSRVMMDVCEALGILNRVVVNVQGVMSKCAYHYLDGIPNRVAKDWTIRDILKFDNLSLEKNKFEKLGLNEREIFSKVRNAIGRTEFDMVSILEYNKRICYYSCNEILRPQFYEYNWKYDKCQKHTIFLSQGNYPLKGLHFVLQAIAELHHEFPDIKLFVAGDDITRRNGSVREHLRLSSYGKYIRKLLKDNELDSVVQFTGFLNEAEMVEQYKKANVYVMASSIENSPNSLCEAMILGVPIVSSYVGGVPSLIFSDECLFYQQNAYYMIAEKIRYLFLNPDFAIQMGIKAKNHAQRTHNRLVNADKTVCIYNEILEKSKGIE